MTDTFRSDEQRPLSPEFVRRFLLGLLPEKEAETLREQLFGQPSMVEEIAAHEDDLIDAYSRGELLGAEKDAFDALYLAHPEKRRRVVVSRALLEAARSQAAPGGARLSTPSGVAEVPPAVAALRAEIAAEEARGNVAVFPGGRSRILPALTGLAAAAALVLAALTTLQRSRLEERLSAAESLHSQKVALLERQVKEQTAAALRAETARVAAEAALAARDAATSATPIAKAVKRAVFTLAMDLVRGEGEPRRLTLPSDVDEVQLKLEVDGNEPYKLFYVTLRSASGRQVFSRGRLSGERVSGNRLVTLNLRQEVLPEGRYELQLQGLTESGKAEDIGYYYFHVNHRNGV
ncbi:MAG: hypothetical protein JNK60_17820 [Acidobacteria bacterium]|nr:hypothetical protein [Acidobacteriota bacterium]